MGVRNMKYKKGDRVECVIGYQGGVFPGETGAVLWASGDSVGVRWDNYRPKRHSCSNLCETGHGWNVPTDHLKLETLTLDLGELPVLDIRDIL